MKLKINEQQVDVAEDAALMVLIDRFRPGADVVILNGFPVSGNSVLREGDELILICRGEVPGPDELEYLMVSRHTPGVHERLKQATVGIAGVGGLGSTVAVALARVGTACVSEHKQSEFT